MTAEQETKPQGFLIMEPPTPCDRTGRTHETSPAPRKSWALEAPPCLSPGPWLEGRSDQETPDPPPTPSSAPSHLMLKSVSSVMPHPDLPPGETEAAGRAWELPHP